MKVNVLFVDCRCLFLRHTQTGKCITRSTELVYNNPHHAFPYFVVLTDNCLDSNAQFRYLNNQLLQSIERQETLVSFTDPLYKNRWAVYKGVAKNAKITQQSSQHRLKQTAAGSLFFYNANNDVCAEPSSKYLLRKTYCNKAKQVFTFGK